MILWFHMFNNVLQQWEYWEFYIANPQLSCVPQWLLYVRSKTLEKWVVLMANGTLQRVLLGWSWRTGRFRGSSLKARHSSVYEHLFYRENLSVRSASFFFLSKIIIPFPRAQFRLFENGFTPTPSLGTWADGEEPFPSSCLHILSSLQWN